MDAVVSLVANTYTQIALNLHSAENSVSSQKDYVRYTYNMFKNVSNVGVDLAAKRKTT